MSSNTNKKIIIIHSYKGGTGKTSIAVNLARYLASVKGKKVLLIEQDTSGASFKNIFRVKFSKTWNDFYSGMHIKDLIVRMDEFDIICACMDEIKIPIDQDSKMFYTRHLERLSIQKKWLIKNYDYILLDTHPGYNYELLNSLFISDISILLTRLDVDTITKTITMYNKIYSHFKKDKKIIIVQNQVPTTEGNDDLKLDLDVEEAMKIWNVFIKNKDLITIPLSNKIAYTLSRSRLVPTDHLFMEHVEKIAQTL